MPILTAEERIGTTLAGKYRLDRILGKGGFGVVYAGVHELTGREIATKVLKHELSEQEQFVKRFLHEARAAAGLNHPNVVDVLDLGQDPDGTVFIVLELLSGQDLSSVIERRGTIPVDEALTYILPVMDALAKAHDQGIVHRDLKPDNIFLNVNSKGEMIPKLLDFGIAKIGDSKGVTSTGMIVGTPHYMSPEQVRGSKQIGPAADVWSMGVVLWQCLTGTVPFDSDSPTGVLGAILTTRAKSVAEVAPHLPPHVIAAIDGALVHEAERRIQNMGALAQALRGGAALAAPGHSIRVDTGPMQAPRPTPPTVNLAMTPLPGGMTPLPVGMTPVPGGMTPIPGITPPPGAMHTPSSFTPTGQMVEPPKSKSGLVIGGAAAAALVLAGFGVLGAVAFWPSEDAEASGQPAAAAPETTTPAAVEPPAAADPAPTPEAPAAVAAVEPEAEAPEAEAPEAEAPAAEAPEAEAEAPAQVAEARPRHRRRQPVAQPQVRTLGPGPVATPVARPVRSTNPTVGNRGAPILR